MKLIVCFLMVVANISYNGKASLDSFVPMSTNILFEDTTKYADKSCYRPCKFNVKPRRCHYDFQIEPMIQEDGKPSITVNGLTPGPPIHVCVNDIIVVVVKNKVPGQDLALHWHGLDQSGTPYMDGVPMITQCPISYGSTFKYAFRASSPGTFFYHADSVTHQSDGVYGSLIVNQPQPMEPHSSLYDYDRSQENTLVVAAKFPELMTANLEDFSQLKPSSLLINGVEDDFKVFVLPGFAYRLRLINAIAIDCPVVAAIDQHEMVVISTDGKPVKPLSTSRVQLYPGERMDVVVRAGEETGGYWVRVSGGGACADLGTSAMLLYSGFNYTAMLHEGKKEVAVENKESRQDVYGQKLESLQEATSSVAARSVVLSIDRNQVQFKDTDNDFRYISDAIPKKPFFPASLSLNKGVVQINKKSFLYPNAPLLIRPEDIRKEIKCTVGEEMKNQEPQCMLVLDAHLGEVLELVLLNEGFGCNKSYTFHMHGYGMQVVATWQRNNGVPISKDEFLKFDKEGRIQRNLLTPPLKDTITVPNKGFAIVRIKVDRGGSWLLECRSCGLASLPTAVVINAPETLPKSLVDSIPKCGTYKPPDVLLN